MASRLEECDSDCAVKMDFDQELSELEYRRSPSFYTDSSELTGPTSKEFHRNTTQPLGQKS